MKKRPKNTKKKDVNTEQTQVVSTGYKPRPIQLWLHSNVKRFNVVVAHRRFGKTFFAINEIIDQAFRNKLKNPQYAYIAPSYGQAKRVAWDYFKEFTKQYPLRVVNEAELRIDLERPGTGDRIRFLLLGAENPAGIRGIYLDGVIMDEYAEMDPIAWSQVVRPALADRKGWAIFIGTPKGMNHFEEVHRLASLKMKDEVQKWFTCILKASETGILPIEELEDARSTMTEEEYNQEFECSFAAAMVGSIFGKEMEKADDAGRITDVPYDKTVRVNTYWDLGISDSTSIWFIQQVGSKYNVIDYYENSGEDLSHYVKVLNERGYLYGENEFPHDVAARSLESGRSRQEILEGLGVRVRLQKRHMVSDQIEAGRMAIGKCWFDKTKCVGGLNTLRNYRRVWDSRKKVFGAPLHNWASHGASAWQCFAMSIGRERVDVANLPKKAVMDYDVFSI